MLGALFGLMAQSKPGKYPTDVTTDIALIYAGGDQRPDWTEDELRPYVVHTFADGSRDWLFDAFLFLEFSSGSTGVSFQNGGGSNYADRKDWQWLLDRNFEKGTKLDALDKVIEGEKKNLGNPPMRHKVVMSIPGPIVKQKEWGKLNGKKLDFARPEDRVAACKWYIDELVDRFNKAGYKNIDLAGIYWVEEALFSNGPIMPEINDYIRSKGLRAYWIPYYKDNEQFRFNWKDKYGFDIAYQQPNYFFERDIPMKRLADACDESKLYGMGLEMEFETQGRSKVQFDDPDSYYQRLVDYIDMFESKGVFDESAIAWYTGTKGVLDMARSSDEHNHSVMDRLARHIVKRRSNPNLFNVQK